MDLRNMAGVMPGEWNLFSKLGGPAAGTTQNISELERWVSMGAGAAMVLSGLTRGRGRGLVMSLVGGALLYRGYSGHYHLYDSLGIDTAEHSPSTAVPAKQGFKLEKTVAIQRSASDLYRFWSRLENLPQVMKHLKEVRELGSGRSHWLAHGLAGKDIHWHAEIMNQRENELIAWRSLPGGDLETAGSVHFRPLGPNQGTAVTVSLKYNPPGGKLGATLASIFGAGVEQKISEDLQNFKRLMESESASSAKAGSRTGSSGQAFGPSTRGNGETMS